MLFFPTSQDKKWPLGPCAEAYRAALLSVADILRDAAVVAKK
jgi:hypothetical protein